jgi:hypothetical protein
MEGKAETLIQEILVGTAFFGGFWTAIELDPNVVIVNQLGKVLATLLTHEAANQYVGFGKTIIMIAFLAGVVGSYTIGRKTGFAAFWVMYAAGALFITVTQLSVLLMVVGFLMGAIAVQMHTDERIQYGGVGPAGRFRR